MTEAEVTTEKEGTLCSCRILFNPNSVCASVSIFLVYTIKTVGFFRLRFCFNGQCELGFTLHCFQHLAYVLQLVLTRARSF